MTTNTYSATAVITDTTMFRAWGLALSNALTAAGLPLTADTGQINWATVTRPGANNTVAGYEIRYLNDSLHGTKPCYIKIEYGTGGSNAPGLWFTCSSSTDGAGNATGTTYFIRTAHAGNGAANVGNYPTFVCTGEGYFGGAFYRRGQLTSHPAFFVCRTCDASGTPTSDGFYFYSSPSSTPARTTYLSSAITDADKYCLIPGAQATTLVSGDVQVFRHFGHVADLSIKCVPFLLSYYDSEIGNESTFTASPSGVSHTYLALGGATSQSACCAGGLSAARIAMRYD